MAGEYRTLTLFPAGHLMSYLRPRLPLGVVTSAEVAEMADGADVALAGLVIRRQRPCTSSGVTFITLEDEHGHTSLVVWPQVYRRLRRQIKQPVLLARGRVSRRDGAMNVVVQDVQPIGAVLVTPPAKNFC